MSNDNSVNILKEERKRLLERVATIDSLLELIEGGGQDSPHTEKATRGTPNDLHAYHPKRKMSFKVIFILKNHNRFLHSTEIKREIAKRDGVKVETLKNLSTTLTNLRREGKICKYKLDKQNRNTFWGSPKWLTPDGTVLPQHMYDINVLGSTDVGEQIEL